MGAILFQPFLFLKSFSASDQASYNVTNLLSNRIYRSILFPSSRVLRAIKSRREDKNFLWLFNFNKFALWIWPRRCGDLKIHGPFGNRVFSRETSYIRRTKQSSHFIVFFQIGLRNWIVVVAIQREIWSNKWMMSRPILAVRITIVDATVELWKNPIGFVFPLASLRIDKYLTINAADDTFFHMQMKRYERRLEWMESDSRKTFLRSFLRFPLDIDGIPD